MLIAKTYDNIRNDILTFLREQKLTRPSFRVVDVGGAAGTWCDEVVDAYIDLREFPTNKKLYVGDICRDSVWAQIPDKEFDFAICTHVLEDLRDPVRAIMGIERIAKSGFVAVPTKWDEFSPVEDPLWLGNCHHRWILDFDDESEGIKILPKSVASNRFMRPSKYLYYLNPKTIARLMLSKAKIRESGYLLGPDINRLNWRGRDPKIRSSKDEMCFVWYDKIPFKFTDWHPNARAVLDDYRRLFASNADYSANVQAALQKLREHLSV